MRVVDTSAWIEFYAGTTLGRRLASEIPARDDCIVPTVIQFEIAKWMSREVSDEAAAMAIADTEQCVVAPLDTSVALAAAQAAAEHRLSLADAVIYATARTRAADLLTCDAHFDGLPGVIYVPKVAP